VTAALDVSYPADRPTVSEVGRSCAVETAERQNTVAEPYSLWDAPLVEIALERRDAFRNSPDLNPVDYSTWGVITDNIYISSKKFTRRSAETGAN